MLEWRAAFVRLQVNYTTSQNFHFLNCTWPDSVITIKIKVLAIFLTHFSKAISLMNIAECCSRHWPTTQTITLCFLNRYLILCTFLPSPTKFYMAEGSWLHLATLGVNGICVNYFSSRWLMLANDTNLSSEVSWRLLRLIFLIHKRKVQKTPF